MQPSPVLAANGKLLPNLTGSMLAQFLHMLCCAMQTPYHIGRKMGSCLSIACHTMSSQTAAVGVQEAHVAWNDLECALSCWRKASGRKLQAMWSTVSCTWTGPGASGSASAACMPSFMPLQHSTSIAQRLVCGSLSSCADQPGS